LEFVIPASHEQRRIAGVLAALDDKIEHERQLVKKLRSLIQGAAGKAVAFGSDVRTVGSIAEFSNKKRVPLSASERARRRGPYPYYGATGIFDYVDDFLFDDRYVLIGEDGSVVREDGSPFVQYVWGRLWVNNHAHVLTGNGLSTELLAVLLETANVSSAVTGAVQPKLSMGRLKSVEVSVPSDRAEIERLAAVVFGLVRAANDEIKTLSALRDELLPKLVSGALRVCGSYDPDDVLGTLAEEAAAAA
jgi:type I restriction enzyme S subunit